MTIHMLLNSSWKRDIEKKPLKKREHKKFNQYLRHFFANNRTSSLFDIIHNLEFGDPELAKSLVDANKILTCESYLARYWLPKYVKEGWLKIDGQYTEIQLSPERCSYCFKNIASIYVIDIDNNRYCGWKCTEKCHYYSDPYESNFDAYLALFDRFAHWLPECANLLNTQEGLNRQAIEILSKEIEEYISDIYYDDFRSLNNESSCVDVEIHRMLGELATEVQRLQGSIHPVKHSEDLLLSLYRWMFSISTLIAKRLSGRVSLWQCSNANFACKRDRTTSSDIVASSISSFHIEKDGF